MHLNVQEFLNAAGVTEPLYPGKRMVHQCRQPGEFKSHCVVFDWRDPAKIRIEVKAGLSGRTLEPQKLRYYPVCFQTPTYIDVEIVNDRGAPARRKRQDEDSGDESGEKSGSASGSSGGGGRQPVKDQLTDMKLLATEAFIQASDGKLEAVGRIVDMVVLGTKIAAESYGRVMESLAQQLSHARVSATELLAKAGNFVTKYTPPSFMRPAGNEDAVYHYDREKNADIGFRPSLGL